MRIVARDGTTVRIVSYPYDVDMGSIYKSDDGYTPTGFSATSSLSPSVIDLEGILSIDGISLNALNAGNWDGAKSYLFATTFGNPIEDEEPLGKFIFGKVQINDDRYVCELMHLIDALNQQTGRTVGPLCIYTLFDETLDGDVIPANRSRCTGPRAAPDGPSLASYKVTGTVTSVTSRSVWRDSTRAEAADYFGVGAIRWTSGLNIGLKSQEIKDHAANGTITQFLPWPYDIQIGDAYEMIPGCRKRRTEDCVAKYGDGINHGGFNDLIVPSDYQEIGNG